MNAESWRTHSRLCESDPQLCRVNSHRRRMHSGACRSTHTRVGCTGECTARTNKRIDHLTSRTLRIDRRTRSRASPADRSLTAADDFASRTIARHFGSGTRSPAPIALHRVPTRSHRLPTARTPLRIALRRPPIALSAVPIAFSRARIAFTRLPFTAQAITTTSHSPRISALSQPTTSHPLPIMFITLPLTARPLPRNSTIRRRRVDVDGRLLTQNRPSSRRDGDRTQLSRSTTKRGHDNVG